MYSESDLERAVSAGAISPEAAGALRRFVAEQSAAPAVDEEHFRLITGFNDIFVAIASALLLIALAWIGYEIGPRIPDGPSLTSGLLVAIASWGLAEFFTARRRMALPSILLLLSFTGGVMFTALGLFMQVLGEPMIDNNPQLAALLFAASAAIATAATWAHWRRFRVPITVAAGAATIGGVALALVASIVADVPGFLDIMLTAAFALGIGIFFFAMWWDASDRARTTRRADVAFWLHLLAAPLIVHPVFHALGVLDNSISIGSAVMVILLYVVLGLVALAIDRRALMVSALVYVLYALSTLFRELGAVGLNVALTALVIGSALLLLSAFWHSARALVVGWLPAGLRAQVPDVEPQQALATRSA